MKKIIVLMVVILNIVLLCACSSDNVDTTESETGLLLNEESITTEIDSIAHTEVSSVLSSGSLSLEDVTSIYVEPDFKVVSSVSECYDYLESEADDTVTTEKDSDDRISLITVTDKDGNIKSTMKFTYNEKIVATATFYGADDSTEKIAFSFYDENTLNIIAHVNSESEMSLYLYNKDGSFNSYVDGAGFSSLLVGSLLEGFGGVLSK